MYHFIDYYTAVRIFLHILMFARRANFIVSPPPAAVRGRELRHFGQSNRPPAQWGPRKPAKL